MARKQRALGINSEAGQYETSAKFADETLYVAATLYYVDGKTQADVAVQLGTSRATVSRLLSEARRRGIVNIEVVPPTHVDDAGLARRTAEALGIRAVHLCPTIRGRVPGPALAAALRPALVQQGLRSGDTILFGSGRTLHALSLSDMPELPGVTVVPTIGGHDEPEKWYQPNEITRQFAERVHGNPRFIFAPAMPSPKLFDSLMNDDAMRDILDLWAGARCAIVSVGAPPLTRDSLPRFIARGPALSAAVGDVGARFFDREGRPINFPGSDRLVATHLETLRTIPTTIAVAYGMEKIEPLIAAAKAGYYMELVTDVATADAIVDTKRGQERHRARHV